MAAAGDMREVATFAAVGVAATATHLLVALGLHAAGSAPQAANLGGWLVALGVSFLGHARLTFRVEGAIGPYLPRFALLSGAGYALSAAIVAAGSVAGWPFWLSLAVVGGTVPAATYLLARRAVFAGAASWRYDPADALAAVLGLAVFAWFRDAYVNHDVAWYLVAGRQWIEGASLYTDLSEVNPPLAFYLLRGALHLGDLFGLDPAGALAAFVALLTASALTWSACLLPRATPLRLPFLAAVAAAVTLPFLGHFGQREHLMTLLALPWAMAALFLPAPLSAPGAAARGLVAGVGICLKPHFLVYPALLTVCEIARERSLRPVLAPANLAMGAVGAGYVAATAILHPAYFTQIVPDARLVYGAYTLPFELFVQNLRPWPMALSVAVVLAAALRGGWALRRALALVAAGLAAYALQGNGFTYHAAPAQAFAMIALAFVALAAAPALRMAAAASFALLAQGFVAEGGYRNPLSEPLEAHLAAEGLRPERLLVWSPSLLPAFPLVLSTGADWAGHAGSLWLLPGTLDLVEAGGAPEDPRREVLARQRALMARDLARCPDVLILDHVLPFRDRPLDVLAYAGPDIASMVGRDYARRDRVGRFEILLRRTACR